ncbi:hypothetical protein ACFLXJ_01625 [Chloroflexota bacterium]
METTAQQSTWKPTTAGILNIIVGALGVLSAMGLIIALISIGTINIMCFLPPADAPFIAPMITTILIIVLIFSAIYAVFPIIGGVFALQRKRWGWALAGSIIAILGIFPLGVAATIFVAMAKDEFK